jgi:hypothetical protein
VAETRGSLPQFFTSAPPEALNEALMSVCVTRKGIECVLIYSKNRIHILVPPLLSRKVDATVLIHILLDYSDMVLT